MRTDELLIDCEEDRVVRTVLVGMLLEGDRPPSPGPPGTSTHLGDGQRSEAVKRRD